jgi:hypothetical protein
VAVYKFFPTKDASLYSYFPSRSAGIDEMLEVYNQNNITVSPQVSRYVIKFDQESIDSFISNNSATESINFSLKNFIAYAQGFNLDTELYVYPVSGSWENGTGKFADNPETTNGVSWLFRDSKDLGTNWNFAGVPYSTQSFNTTYSPEGGGVWYTGSAQGKRIEVSQSFSLRSDKDLNIDVTDIGLAWYSSSNSIGSDTDIPNNGFLVKLDNSIEFSLSQSQQPISRYFSVDTNTIYPPILEFKWDDYLNNSTGSSTTNITGSTNNWVASLRENKEEYQQDSVTRFFIYVRPKYPIRTYITTSNQVINYYLPDESFYAIKDLDTDEFIINFDTIYTKISRNNTLNYFDIHMNGLEPERYYKILIKSIYGNRTDIIDNEMYFKVTNG